MSDEIPQIDLPAAPAKGGCKTREPDPAILAFAREMARNQARLDHAREMGESHRT